MHDPAFLYPIFALAAWTAVVLVLVGVARIGAGLCGQVAPSDFRLGESARVPPRVSIPNRNYMNLLELPVLFYVVCIVLYVSRQPASLALLLAWFFVALRILHSLVHLTYNNVLHRLAVFAVSNVTLLGLWVVAGLGLASSRA